MLGQKLWTWKITGFLPGVFDWRTKTVPAISTATPSIKVKNEKRRRARGENNGEETRSKAEREFLLSFQPSLIRPVPEIPRIQCEAFFYAIVRLNGAVAPRLHNEARPFAVTPPHQGEGEGGARRRKRRCERAWRRRRGDGMGAHSRKDGLRKEEEWLRVVQPEIMENREGGGWVGAGGEGGVGLAPDPGTL